MSFHHRGQVVELSIVFDTAFRVEDPCWITMVFSSILSSLLTHLNSPLITVTVWWMTMVERVEKVVQYYLVKSSHFLFGCKENPNKNFLVPCLVNKKNTFGDISIISKSSYFLFTNPKWWTIYVCIYISQRSWKKRSEQYLKQRGRSKQNKKCLEMWSMILENLNWVHTIGLKITSKKKK